MQSLISMQFDMWVVVDTGITQGLRQDLVIWVCKKKSWVCNFFLSDCGACARSAHHERVARSPCGRGPGPLKGPGKFWFLDAPWCNLRVISTYFLLIL